MAKKEDFETKVKLYFKKLKHDKTPLTVDIKDNGIKIGQLEFFNEAKLMDKELIKNLADWRRASQWFFPSQFKVTIAGTKSWAVNGLLNKEDRILFLVKDKNDKVVGHMGLYSFDFKKMTCEIDNVIRGLEGQPGIMTNALNTLVEWTFANLGISDLYLRVFSDNSKAISLYERCNFNHKNLIPLYRKEEESGTFWEEANNGEKAERYFLKMKYVK